MIAPSMQRPASIQLSCNLRRQRKHPAHIRGRERVTSPTKPFPPHTFLPAAPGARLTSSLPGIVTVSYRSGYRSRCQVSLFLQRKSPKYLGRCYYCTSVGAKRCDESASRKEIAGTRNGNGWSSTSPSAVEADERCSHCLFSPPLLCRPAHLKKTPMVMTGRIGALEPDLVGSPSPVAVLQAVSHRRWYVSASLNGSDTTQLPKSFGTDGSYSGTAGGRTLEGIARDVS